MEKTIKPIDIQENIIETTADLQEKIFEITARLDEKIDNLTPIHDILNSYRECLFANVDISKNKLTKDHLYIFKNIDDALIYLDGALIYLDDLDGTTKKIVKIIKEIREIIDATTKNREIKKSYIFFTKEGYTVDYDENDTHNCQILGWATGKSPKNAFDNFKNENKSIITDTTFKEVCCQELMPNIENMSHPKYGVDTILDGFYLKSKYEKGE